MTNAETTKNTNHYFRVLVVLVTTMMALMGASLMSSVQPARASLFYTVNETGDEPDANPGDGLCGTQPNAPLVHCTLRAAIQESNANPVTPEHIFFNIPGEGVHTIAPTSALPTITDPVEIDGYSQPGTSPNTAAKGTNAVIEVVLSGANAPIGQGTDGLVVSGGGTTVKGLVINGFKENSTFTGGAGIKLLNVPGNTKNVVEGNFIGTDAAGTADVGNEGAGIQTFPESISNTIGGSSPADRNLISGNDGSGVNLVSSVNFVQNNLIGTDKSGTKDLGNGFVGVGISFNSGNAVDGNTIAFNGSSGVSVSGETSFDNLVANNSIFSNGGLGIDLNGDGATANDPGDSDTGPNNLQNKPEITSASTSASGTNIKVNLNSRPGTDYLFQFFSNPKGLAF